MNRWVVLKWCRTAESRYHVAISLPCHSSHQFHYRAYTSLANSPTTRLVVTRQNIQELPSISPWLQVTFRRLSKSSKSSTPTTTTSTTTTTSKAATDSQEAIVLYVRDNTWQRNLLPWANVAVMSTLVGFFIWHAFVYIPRYNSQSLKDKEQSRSGFMLDAVGTEVDPSGDYAALIYGGIHLYASLIYARRLVSRIVLTKRRELHIWTHRWPAFTPVANPTKYPLGDVGMNANRTDMQKILNKLDGNIHWYRGHLGIFHQKKEGTYPYFLSIKKEHEVKQPEILLHAMVNPGFLTQKNFRQTFKPPSALSRKR